MLKTQIQQLLPRGRLPSAQVVALSALTLALCHRFNLHPEHKAVVAAQVNYYKNWKKQFTWNEVLNGPWLRIWVASKPAPVLLGPSQFPLWPVGLLIFHRIVRKMKWANGMESALLPPFCWAQIWEYLFFLDRGCWGERFFFSLKCILNSTLNCEGRTVGHPPLFPLSAEPWLCSLGFCFLVVPLQDPHLACPEHSCPAAPLPSLAGFGLSSVQE